MIFEKNKAPTTQKDKIDKIVYHVEILNHEVGELRDCYKESSIELKKIGADVIEQKSNVDWIKKILYVIATAVIGAVGVFGTQVVLKLFVH